ncbi:peroxiredoxin [Ferroplasma sp.]|uniref:peroxiredoxin n=1 Tax=Ferroplasma sp. TaxID=2591003 RepID=UPI00307DBE0E
MAVYLGQKAPGFIANTTKGVINLEDYEGKWVILFSHPADFTPVCTTEFMDFAKRYPEFQKINVELIGLSVDSIFSHIEWMKNIKEKFGVDIPFPVIADINKEVARDYNMMDEKTGSTVRGVFIIDPNMTVRLMIYYPAETGRNIDEIMRSVKALQLNWERKLATPVNWQPGNDGIVSAPVNLEDAISREKNGSKAWYLKYEAVK